MLRSYIPENLIQNPCRQDKGYLWRIICKLDPAFATAYREESLRR